MKQLEHIGTIEHISLPDDNIFDVPAKVDTGADNSSISASNIRLRNGKLRFNLFTPGSVYYIAKPVVSTAFRVTTVRSSFGHKEFRYKIKIKVKIGDRTLTRWFTLADRSRNNYPILLGKNFLKNNFIVDVSKMHLTSQNPATNSRKVLIFTDYPKESQDFVKKLQSNHKQKVRYDLASYDDLIFYVGENMNIINTVKNIDLADYDFVYFKNHHKRELSATAAQYLHYRNRQFADQEFLTYMSASKLSEYMRLNIFGVNIPPSICASTPKIKEIYGKIVESFGLPFVLKEIYSDRGKDNYLIKTENDFNKIIKEAAVNQVFCAQKYIPNDGFYRIYVMNKEVSLAIWRSATTHADRLKVHLNKPRGSANAILHELDKVPGEAQNLALRAAHCMDRQVSGVDLVRDLDTGIWYVLEANNDPQLRTGSFLDAKAQAFAKYIDKELNQ